MTVLVEPFAGLASLTNYLYGLKPPCSRLGSKAGYTHAISREMGLNEPPSHVLLVDVDSGLINALRNLFHRPAQLGAEVALMGTRGHDARSCWDLAKLEKDESAAAYWLWMAGAYRGVGRYRGNHIRRPNIDGFSPCRTELARRIACRPVLKQVDVLCCSAMQLEPFPNGFVYCDPPYSGAAGYGPKVSFDLYKFVDRWVSAGSLVAVSESKLLDLGSGFRYTDITHERKGQKRKDSRSVTEWLHVSR